MSEPGQLPGREPVFRYSLRLPKEHWFHQRKEEAVYWLSIVAVYKDSIPEKNRWGWTNHRHVYNDDAVVGASDFNAMRVSFGLSLGQPLYNPHVDRNADDVIGGLDFDLLRNTFFQSPGPSGLACAGTVPCPGP